MSQTQSNHQQKPRFEGARNGLVIQPHEIFQFFRTVRVGQTVSIKRGHFIGKSFKVIGKQISAEGNYLIVDADSEKMTAPVTYAKSNICSQCKRDADFECSCLPTVPKLN